jgi:hypothetical protein
MSGQSCVSRVCTAPATHDGGVATGGQ